MFHVEIEHFLGHLNPKPEPKTLFEVAVVDGKERANAKDEDVDQRLMNETSRVAMLDFCHEIAPHIAIQYVKAIYRERHQDQERQEEPEFLADLVQDQFLNDGQKSG
jgi:hypothetical protein